MQSLQPVTGPCSRGIDCSVDRCRDTLRCGRDRGAQHVDRHQIHRPRVRPIPYKALQLIVMHFQHCLQTRHTSFMVTHLQSLHVRPTDPVATIGTLKGMASSISFATGRTSLFASRLGASQSSSS